MNKISTVLKILKLNWLLLLSTVAAIGVFWSPSFLPTVVAIFAFLILTLIIIINNTTDKKPTKISSSRMAIGLIMALGVASSGFHTFGVMWTPSNKVSTLATSLGTSNTSLVLTVAMVGCIVGFYSMYKWSIQAIDYAYIVLTNMIPDRRIRNKSYLKQNWFFPVSAAGFWILNSSLTTSFFSSFVLSLSILIFLSSRLPLNEYVKNTRLAIRILSLLTSSGVVICSQLKFCSKYDPFPLLNKIEFLFPIKIDLSWIVSIPLSMISVFFVYYCVTWFWNKCIEIIRQTSLLNDFQWKELAIYIFLLTLSLVFMIAVFSKTDAFYGMYPSYSKIYTGDAFMLVEGDVYLNIMHSENDLRQPLFAVFSAPFIGIPYLISVVFQFGESIKAILENGVQIVMLFIANLTLAQMMRLNAVKRVCFMLLSSVTYTQLLFILMMEQYIVSYFWLIFCLYLIEEKGRPDQFVFWGAGGSLITSAIVLPFISTKSPVVDVKAWFKDIINHGFQFVLIIIAFCRFTVFLDLFYRITVYQQFSGIHVTFYEKVCQFSVFIKSCLLAPAIVSNKTMVELSPANFIDLIGVFIFLTAFVSAFWNRNKKSSLIAFGWLLYSIVLLLIVGWGTAENGLILYSLYFGWPLLVLLFQFVEKLEEKMKTHFLVPVFTGLAFFALIVQNARGISELIRFGVDNYPV